MPPISVLIGLLTGWWRSLRGWLSSSLSLSGDRPRLLNSQAGEVEDLIEFCLTWMSVNYMTDEQKQFLAAMAVAAKAAGHCFPEMAACEAALESAWGKSALAVQDHNLFGMKAHRSAAYGTHILPTREFENGEWITVIAKWTTYASEADCFADRMATLVRLAPSLPHYAAALDATNAETYIREVSASWATDPERAEKCLAIYRQSGLQSD